MEIVQLNLALSTSSERIREPKFNTVKRGYEPAQVLEYLSKIADRMQALESQVKELGSQLERANQERDEAVAVVSSAPDSYEQVTSRVADLMVGLDRDVARLRSEAEADAAKIREEAQTEAQRIQAEAGEMNALAQATTRRRRGGGRPGHLTDGCPAGVGPGRVAGRIEPCPSGHR